MLIGCANENDEASSSASEFNIEKMTIIEHERSDSLDEANHLSLEEAALAGVEYILSFFDFNFEGTYMQLQHIADGENSIFNYNGSIWRGRIYQSERLNFDNEGMFFFVVKASNGEWINIVRWPFEYLIKGYSVRELSGKPMEELRELLPPPEEDEINRMLEVASVYAQRHFKNSNLHHIEYYSDMILTIGFRAEDEYGYVIYISIQRDTHNLIAILR